MLKHWLAEVFGAGSPEEMEDTLAPLARYGRIILLTGFCLLSWTLAFMPPSATVAGTAAQLLAVRAILVAVFLLNVVPWLRAKAHALRSQVIEDDLTALQAVLCSTEAGVREYRLCYNALTRHTTIYVKAGAEGTDVLRTQPHQVAVSASVTIAGDDEDPPSEQNTVGTTCSAVITSFGVPRVGIPSEQADDQRE